MENAEINNLVKIMGLQFKEKYEDIEKIRSLRYGKIMIMTDQDNDGSHIKGLLINFFHHFWPSLLKHNLVEEFITPIVKVTFFFFFSTDKPRGYLFSEILLCSHLFQKALNLNAEHNLVFFFQ